jgi:hypothetical protein
MNVPFKNPRTGEVKQVKVGWSWILFLFSGFFGLPLFLRRLQMWGWIFLALWAVNLVGSSLVPGIAVIMFFIFLGLVIFMGIKGNELTAKNLLDLGWMFAEPESETTKRAKITWGITP